MNYNDYTLLYSLDNRDFLTGALNGYSDSDGNPDISTSMTSIVTNDIMQGTGVFNWTYTFGNDSINEWVYVNNWTVNQNWEGFDGLCFCVEGDNSNNTFELRVLCPDWNNRYIWTSDDIDYSDRQCYNLSFGTDIVATGSPNLSDINDWRLYIRNGANSTYSTAETKSIYIKAHSK